MFLTEKQLAVLNFIRDFIQDKGISPTLDEMSQFFNVSKITIYEHVNALEKKGAITKTPNMARSITLVEDALLELGGDEIWSGFGNNGGEEFLSYMMTSEAKVITGGDSWDSWHGRLVNLFGSIQNENGSWSGHHCITSPVFCTAAVILALTADRDHSLHSNNNHHHH